MENVERECVSLSTIGNRVIRARGEKSKGREGGGL